MKDFLIGVVIFGVPAALVALAIRWAASEPEWMKRHREELESANAIASSWRDIAKAREVSIEVAKFRVEVCELKLCAVDPSTCEDPR